MPVWSASHPVGGGEGSHMEMWTGPRGQLADRLWAKDTAMDRNGRKALSGSPWCGFPGSPILRTSMPWSIFPAWPFINADSAGRKLLQPADLVISSRHEKAHHGRSEVAQGNGDGGGHFRENTGAKAASCSASAAASRCWGCGFGSLLASRRARRSGGSGSFQWKRSFPGRRPGPR